MTQFRRLRSFSLFVIVLAVVTLLLSVRWLSVIPIFAQSDCEIADTINYPVDTNIYRMAQEFAAPSPRHQGRYHTGEDWYGGRGTSYGQPVMAAANGRVTYAYPLGWGRDGGVVIIEHTFPDGTVAYTQYGHIMETDAIKFPARLSCVEAGQIIGAIGDSRPAPHLHFEVRVANPDTPGPGYAWGNPLDDGWRDPGQFVTNMQTWLHPAHRLHLTTDDGLRVPPFVLNDGSVLYVIGDTLRRATPDGRVMWRVQLEREVVHISGLEGRPLLTFADGTVQYFSLEGAGGDSWRVDFSPAGAPLPLGDWLLYPTTDGALAALGPERGRIVWRMDNVPDFVRWHVTGDESGFVIGLITPQNEILTIAQTGEVVDRALLRDIGSLATAPDGALLAYTRGGLWRIDSAGEWSLMLEDAPPGGGSGAVHVLDDGGLLLFDGGTLHAYWPDLTPRWQADLGGVSGLTEIHQYGERVLLTSTHGSIAALNTGGQFCNQVQIYGDDRSRQWHDLGADGVLRVAIGTQILGLDWTQFTRGC